MLTLARDQMMIQKTKDNSCSTNIKCMGGTPSMEDIIENAAFNFHGQHSPNFVQNQGYNGHFDK